MAETAVSPTPEAPAATPASPEPAAETSGTAAPSGSEAQAAAPSEESFFSGDPNSLPPELQTAYKNMLKDYKQKTQSIAETRKKAQAYEQISKDQRFVDYWSGLNKQQKADLQDQKTEAVKRLAERVSPEEFQKAFTSPEEFMAFLEKANQYTSEASQKKIDQLEQQLSVKDAADVVESFATEMDKSGKAVRPDFYALDEDQLISGYLNVNPPDGKSGQAYIAKLNEAYGWAKAVTQKYYEKGKAEALARIQQKAGTSTEMPTNGAKGVYQGSKRPDVSEAIALARKGIRVPRDD